MISWHAHFRKPSEKLQAWKLCWGWMIDLSPSHILRLQEELCSHLSRTTSLMPLSVRSNAAVERYVSIHRVYFPQKQKVKLALRSTHWECYLLGIVVVILCPVWQCINEQHANTFCWNICDRHIFRLPSKSEKKEKKMFSICCFPLLKVCKISLSQMCLFFLSLWPHFPLSLLLNHHSLAVHNTKSHK